MIRNLPLAELHAADLERNHPLAGVRLVNAYDLGGAEKASRGELRVIGEAHADSRHHSNRREIGGADPDRHRQPRAADVPGDTFEFTRPHEWKSDTTGQLQPKSSSASAISVRHDSYSSKLPYLWDLRELSFGQPFSRTDLVLRPIR